jgi:hypothetical protein
MITIIDRGADLLQAAGRIGAETAEALKAEARRRSDAGEFRLHCVCELHRPQAGPRRLIKALMRLAGIEPAASRSGGARSIP